MAGLSKDPQSGNWKIRFRFRGREYKASLKTTAEDEADRLRARAEETILLIERGRLEMPAGADVATFILSDGKIAHKHQSPDSPTLGRIAADYQSELPSGAKALTTVKTERIHIAHLLRLLGENSKIATVSHQACQRYADDRAKERFRKRPIGAETIRKELATLGVLWEWARKRQLVVGECPAVGVVYPKSESKPPFRTYQQITEAIARGIPKAQQPALWECLFLSVDEVVELLAYVKGKAARPYVYPLFSMAAWTGARRSEILRAEIGDFDFKSGIVTIREKKRVQSRSLSYRTLPMHAELATTMRSWFANHPGGQYAIANKPGPLHVQTADKAFERALRGSKWGEVRGFHVFRHSMVSNLAAAGVNDAVIRSWLGHQTEEMMARYRHLLPADTQRGIEALSIDRALRGQ